MNERPLDAGITHHFGPRVPYSVPMSVDASIENVGPEVQHEIHTAYTNECEVPSLVCRMY
jgi:hypothetical protein